MMRALFASVASMRNHQTWLDVIGNNIANVNTVGYKSSRVTFEDAFFQLLMGGSRPTDVRPGVNPAQVGIGMGIASIDQLFGQGTLETTGQPFDLAIQGDALFVLRDGERSVYTRAGNFQLDAQGRLISPSSGGFLQGILATSDGGLSPTAAVQDLKLPVGIKAPARPTDTVTLAGNLDAAAANGATHTISTTVFDSLGTAHDLHLMFTKSGASSWSWTAQSDTLTIDQSQSGTVTFGADGSLQDFTYPGGASTLTMTPTGGGSAVNVTFDVGGAGSLAGLVGFSGSSDAVATLQNGYASGDLASVTVDSRGVVTGFFNNGVSRDLAQIVLASFTNPAGLLREGNNVYSESPSSGGPIQGYAGTSNTSIITPGALEASNVDLSQEFTNMIIAQRGFQAGARMVTTADQILQETVNLRQ